MKNNLSGSKFFMKYALEKNNFSLKGLKSNKYISEDKYGMEQLRDMKDTIDIFEQFFLFNKHCFNTIESYINFYVLYLIIWMVQLLLLLKIIKLKIWKNFMLNISDSVITIKTFINYKYIKNEDTWIRAVIINYLS